MKADIAGKPTDTQFHKIYIQKHENVRYGGHPFHKIYFHVRVRCGIHPFLQETRECQVQDLHPETRECQVWWTPFSPRTSFRNIRLSGMWTLWTRLSTRSTFRNKRMSGKVDWSLFATRSSFWNVKHNEVTTKPYTKTTQSRTPLALSQRGIRFNINPGAKSTWSTFWYIRDGLKEKKLAVLTLLRVSSTPS
jgi:hypothetical protein